MKGSSLDSEGTTRKARTDFLIDSINTHCSLSPGLVHTRTHTPTHVSVHVRAHTHTHTDKDPCSTSLYWHNCAVRDRLLEGSTELGQSPVL